MRWWLKRGEGGGIEDVHDEGVDYDVDAGHLEGDGVEDHDEKNGDENVGAEEQRQQGNRGHSVAGKNIFSLASNIFNSDKAISYILIIVNIVNHLTIIILQSS